MYNNLFETNLNDFNIIVLIFIFNIDINITKNNITLFYFNCVIT